MSRYKAYPDYRDSGVGWLGKIPLSWSAVSIKRQAEIFNGATPKSEVTDYWDGDISWITPADLGKDKSPYIMSGARSITQAGYSSCGTTLVTRGSVILSSRAPIGTLGIAAQELCTNQGCKSLVTGERLDSEYLFYVLLSSTSQLNLLGRGTTFLELSADELGSYKISFPPPADQRTIAAFLDHETAKIDALIEKQQRLIELLKEKRQAVISHAVTKGLNPNAPMKNSGVEWLGEVPAHWKICTLKYPLKSLDNRRIPLSGEERSTRQGEYRYYGASGVIDYIDDYIFDEPTVLVGEDGANLVNRSTPLAFSATGKYWVNNHAHILKAEDDLVDFWAEAIEHIDINPLVSGSAQPKLTAENLNNLKIAFPLSVSERKGGS